MGTKAAWTPERRAKQAEAIRQWQPWAKSTGPRTQAGKDVSSRNAEKGEREQSAMFMEVRFEARAKLFLQAEQQCRLMRERRRSFRNA